MNARARTLLLACSLGCGTAFAQQSMPGEDQGPQDRFEFALVGGGSYSDNVARQEADEESGTIGHLGVRLALDQRTPRLETHVDVNAAYEHYPDDLYDNDVAGGGNAELKVHIVPDSFTWNFQENYGQITADPFSADTPANREDLNYFTTGPEFMAHFGADTSLLLAAHYSDFRYELRDIDGTETGGSLTLAHALSGASLLSFNLTSEKFDFDQDLTNTDYDRYQAFLRYELHGSRTELDVDLGYTRLDLGDGSPDGMLARITFNRQMSSSSALNASIGTEFSDSGNLFRDGQDLQGTSLDASMVLGTSDPFTSDFGTLGYSFERNRTSIGLNFTYERERYETSVLLDRDVSRWDGYFRRRISPVTEFSLYAELSRQDFDGLDYQSDDTRVAVYLTHSLGRRVALRLQFDHYERDASGLLGAGGYDENRASLFVIWTPVNHAGNGIIPP